MPEPVTCRDCGAPGLEEPDIELMPNTCARCFDRRVRPVFELALALRLTWDELVTHLVRVGCHPVRIRQHLRHCVHLYHARN